MEKNVLETIMGAVVLIVAGVFLAFAYEGSQTHMEAGYTVSGKFNDISGISLGSDIRIGGIKVGVVSNLVLDLSSYEAIVSMQIRNNIKIPKDSSAAVVSNGLLGDKYIQIIPGGDDTMLKDGGSIQFTQSSVNIEKMIGQMIYSGGGVDKGGADKKPVSSSSAPSSAGTPTLKP